MSNYPWCSLTPRDNISDIETRWLECQFWWRLSFIINQNAAVPITKVLTSVSFLYHPLPPPRVVSVSHEPHSSLTHTQCSVSQSVSAVSVPASPRCVPGPDCAKLSSCHTREFCVRTCGQHWHWPSLSHLLQMTHSVQRTSLLPRLSLMTRMSAQEIHTSISLILI